MVFLRNPDSSLRQQVQPEPADYLRRGVQPASESGVASIRYSNADCFYLVSGSAAATTITFASATKNTGAQCIVLNRTAGTVIIATAGGTVVGSATQSAAGACSIWRSDGAAWRRLLSTDGVADPLAVGTLTVASSASFSGSVAFRSAVGFASSASFGAGAAFAASVSFAAAVAFAGVAGFAATASFAAAVAFAGGASFASSASFSGSVLFAGAVGFGTSTSFSGSAAFLSGVGFASSVSISGSVAFGTQPAFPVGAVTSITGGAMIVQAGARLYEMSPGAGTVALVLPDAAAVRGLVARVKIKNGSTGQLLLSAVAGRIEPQSATASSTVTMSGAFDYATFVAGQSDWWIA